MRRGVRKPPEGAALISMRDYDWSNSVRTPRDVRYTRALIGRKAYVHPVTYAIAVLWLVEKRTYTPWRTLYPCSDWSNSVRTPRDVRYTRALIGRKAYVHPVTYAIPVLWLVEKRTYTPWRTP